MMQRRTELLSLLSSEFLNKQKSVLEAERLLTKTNAHAFVNAVTFVHRQYFNLPPNFDHTRAGITE